LEFFFFAHSPFLLGSLLFFLFVSLLCSFFSRDGSLIKMPAKEKFSPKAELMASRDVALIGCLHLTTSKRAYTLVHVYARMRAYFMHVRYTRARVYVTSLVPEAGLMTSRDVALIGCLHSTTNQRAYTCIRVHEACVPQKS
jgi:hypothetical protein